MQQLVVGRGKVMAKCMECGKQLGMLEGYHHPLFGKRFLFCSKCYNIIDKKGSRSVKKTKEKKQSIQ